MKDVSSVGQLSFVQDVTNSPVAAPDLPVGARLQLFWEKWEAIGASPKVIRIPKEGYTLPFCIQPNSTRSLTTISCYVYPLRNSFVREALYGLNALELVRTQHSSTNFSWYQNPTTDGDLCWILSILNKFKTEKFKMETPETIRTSLQATNTKPLLKVPTFSCLGSVTPFQRTTIWSVHSTHRIHGSDQGGKTDALHKGIIIH